MYYSTRKVSEGKRAGRERETYEVKGSSRIDAVRGQRKSVD